MNSQVYFFNLWRGVDLPEVRECFTDMSKEEVAQLSVGDKVWIDQEPYHPNGKVYGYSPCTIERVETRKHDRYLHHNRGGISTCSSSFVKLANPERLEELLKDRGQKITPLWPEKITKSTLS